jgi:hypothetical protein
MTLEKQVEIDYTDHRGKHRRGLPAGLTMSACLEVLIDRITERELSWNGAQS